MADISITLVEGELAVTLPPLTRTVGDTYADVFQITDAAGSAVDITGFTITFELDRRAEPELGSDVYALAGTITDAPNGLVSFAPTAIEATQVPVAYHYRIVVTDAAGAITTFGPALHKYIT